MSKRKLLQLVAERHVSGWDDPRMPTISGSRRRGYTPEAMRDFCERIGVAKNDSIIDIALLEHCVREDLNRRAPRVMAVLRPLKVVIENYPEGAGRRASTASTIPRTRPRARAGAVLARDLHRAGRLPRGPAEEVLPPVARQGSAAALRLHHQVRRCREGRRTGEVVELRCTTTPRPAAAAVPTGARQGHASTGSRPRTPCQADVRLYDRLFTAERPGDRRRRHFTRPSSTRRRSRWCPAVSSSPASRRRPPARRTSSSGSATSASTRTRRPSASSSIARSRCAISGLGSRRRLGTIRRRSRR